MEAAFIFSLCLASLFPIPFRESYPAIRLALFAVFFSLSVPQELFYQLDATVSTLLALLLSLLARLSQALFVLGGELFDSLQSNALGVAGHGGTQTPLGQLALFIHAYFLFQRDCMLTFHETTFIVMQGLEQSITCIRLAHSYLCTHVSSLILLIAPGLFCVMGLLWLAGSVSRFCRGLSLIAEISVIRISLFWFLLLLALETNIFPLQLIVSHMKGMLLHEFSRAILLQ